MKDASTRHCARAGFLLLAFSLPLGLTFEALHALKVRVYLGSEMRRELWRLAHAHGSLLGILLLTYAGLASAAIDSKGARASISRWLITGAFLMPAGFLLGGILNREGDPSLGILLVPLGAVALLLGLFRAARSVGA